MRKIKVGTRASELALTQSTLMARSIAQVGGFEFELVRITSEGDRLTGSLASLGGAGVFVNSLREALLARECDIVIHSLKDLPTAEVEGIGIATVSRREDPRDALCAREGARLEELPRGASVGTGSPRRAAMLKDVRPDLEIVDIRGNVDTRLRRVEEDLDAVVLAYAGLKRIGREDAASELLDPALFVPAPGQGALAVECREDIMDADDELSQRLIAGLIGCDHFPTRAAVTAERAVLSTLEAGCSAPLGSHATVGGDGLFEMRTALFTDAGGRIDHEVFTLLPGEGEIFGAAREVGREAGLEILAQLDA